MRLRQLLFLLFSVISFGTVAQSRIFENKEGKYTITVPQNWKERVDGTTTDIFAPDEGKLDVWQEFLGISLSETNGLTLEETFTYYMKEDFPGYYKDFKIVKQGEEVISGRKAKWALYSFSNSAKANATTLYNLFYLTQKSETLYSLNAIAEKGYYPKLEATFLSMVHSFKIND